MKFTNAIKNIAFCVLQKYRAMKHFLITDTHQASTFVCNNEIYVLLHCHLQICIVYYNLNSPINNIINVLYHWKCLLLYISFLLTSTIVAWLCQGKVNYSLVLHSWITEKCFVKVNNRKVFYRKKNVMNLMQVQTHAAKSACFDIGVL